MLKRVACFVGAIGMLSSLEALPSIAQITRLTTSEVNIGVCHDQDDVNYYALSADNRHFAYDANERNKWHVLKDGHPQPWCGGLGGICLSVTIQPLVVQG